MAEQTKRQWLTWTLIRRLAIFFALLGVLALAGAWAVYAALTSNLPTVKSLTGYEPPITSRVHAGDGTLIAEFAEQHRVFVPYESIPDHVVQAFVSAEDKKFFEHNGLDFVGMARAALNTLRNKITGQGGLQGGSTITQQVVKNMLLSRDQTIVRKIKEAELAMRVEKAFTKSEIMELYLNEIYLGGRSYGVGSAALNYFDKSLTELDLSQAAILASLAKAPGTVNPYRRPERLMARRNYVLGRMVEDGYITEAEAEIAREKPLSTVRRLRGPEYEAATYFVQELRKEMIDVFGEEELETGGLSIRSTIDTRLQLAAQEALRDGLVTYDRRHGYRGAFATIPLEGGELEALNALDLPDGHGDWEAGLVVRMNTDGTAVLLLSDGARVQLQKEDVTWAKNTYERVDGGAGLAAGDVVLAEVARKDMSVDAPEASAILASLRAEAEEEAQSDGQPVLPETVSVPNGPAKLRQIPEIEGALIAMDPHTGRVLAMAGGFSYWKSAFNRVTQAERQPGSSFKPFVYAAALENGYTPASKVLDAPFVDFDVEADDFWTPGNYSQGRFYGLSTLRLGLEKSRNLMTVRLAQDIGMEAVSGLAERVEIYDRLPPYLAMALGAGETRIIDLAKGYAALVNGGKAIEPTLLDRVQNRHGETLFRHDQRACEGCNAEVWQGDTPPELPDTRPQVLDPITAYQIVHMLEGVVERGTGRIARRVGKPLAGKTGTTNDYKDALFFGFSPDLVAGVWVGFDEPKTLGEGEAGGAVAAPIWTNFMEAALKDEPGLPFRIPSGVRLVQIDARTGELPGPGTDTVIYEAFRPGNEPGVAFSEDDDFSIFGSSRNRAAPGNATPSGEAARGPDAAETDSRFQDRRLGGGVAGAPQPPETGSRDGDMAGGSAGQTGGLAADDLGDTW
mgnify:CR=1 FL=1